MKARTQLWSEMTREEVNGAAEACALVILPLGATEQHGDHLPVDVDHHCAAEVARRVAAEFGNALVAPAVPWGFSPLHMPLGGSLTLGIETYTALLRELLLGIIECGFRRILIINGHAGNKPFFMPLATELAETRQVSIAAATYFDFCGAEFAKLRKTPCGGEGHGGEMETAVELFLRPDLVKTDRFKPRLVERLTDYSFNDLLQPGMGVVGYRLSKLYPHGVMGDPRPATAELGKTLIERSVEQLTIFAKQYYESAERAMGRNVE